MRSLLTLGGLAAGTLVLAGCGSSSPVEPAGPSITTFSLTAVEHDVVTLIETTYGSKVRGMPSCDSPLESVGDISICTATVVDFRSIVGPSDQAFSVKLVDGNGHVRINVQ